MRKWVDEQLVFSVLKPSLGISSSWPYWAINPSTLKAFLVEQSHDNFPLILAISKTADLREGDLSRGKMAQSLFFLFWNSGFLYLAWFLWVIWLDLHGLLTKTVIQFIIITGIHKLEWIREIYTWSFFPHGKYSLSSQALFNPEDNMPCCDFLLVNEKWLNRACSWAIGWQGKPFWSCPNQQLLSVAAMTWYKSTSSISQIATTKSYLSRLH